METRTFSALYQADMLRLGRGKEASFSGKANFTMMGETYACTYKVNGEKLLLDCTPKGETLDLMINGDGSLNAPSFIGVLKKSK